MNPEKIAHHYLICAAWAESGDDDSPLGRFAPEWHASARQIAFETVESFLHDNPHVTASELSEEQIGHDLWLTSQGHGTGFWDRGLPAPIGHGLTRRAKLEHRGVYIGDDGLAYLQ